jgi:hypothetical protein
MKTSILNVFVFLFFLITAQVYGQIIVSLPDTSITAGSIVNIPVKLVGANSSSNQPVLGIDLNVSYLPANLVYSGVTNFYSEMPQSQWTINNLTGLFKAIWIEPSYVTPLEIPDGTVLFEIIFTYTGGSSPLIFTKHDFVNQYNEIINSEAIDGNVGSGSKALNLTAFLEGLYTTGGAMHEAMNDMGEPQWGVGIADQITVELHNELDYLTIEHTASNVDLNTDGTATVSIPATYSGMYYVTIKHRNSIEVVSATVVDFSGAIIDYNYSTAASQAFGDNQKDFGDGVFGLFVGDANQDGLIDGDDLVYMDPDLTVGNIGYLPSDLNGDGLVDGDDLVKGDLNFITGISVVTP